MARRGSRPGRFRDVTLAQTMVECSEAPTPAPDNYTPVVLSRVYLLLDAEACEVKIGYTTDLPRRLRQLNWQRGKKLDLLGTLKGGRDLETTLRRRFSDYRVSGTLDWYRSEIVGELAPMFAVGEDPLPLAA